MFEIPVEELLRGALIFIRVGGILFALPIFGDHTTPVRVRILLSVAIGFALAPLIGPEWAGKIPTDILAFTLLIVRELLIGLMFGFVAKLAFEGILMAANLVGFQMGFGTASLFIQDAGQQMNGFSAFHRLVVMLIFLSLNLHHVFLRAILETFNLIPAGLATPSPELGPFLIKLTAGVFYVAVQLSAPILIALMFTTAALGLVARTVPQLNVFTMSFPVNFFVGLLVYIATIPFFPSWMQQRFQTGYEDIFHVLRGLMP